MIEDSLFWIFFLILFVSAYATAELAGRIRRRRNPLRLLYAVTALAVSVGLWLSSPSISGFGTAVFHISNGVALILGALIALFPPLLFIPLLLPIVLSLLFHQPLKPLFPEKEPVLGTLEFLPSENSQLKLIWDNGEEETLILLQGEKAALLVMSCKARPAFFFLKDRYIVLGVGSLPVSPGEISDSDSTSFLALDKRPDEAERFYHVHYPAQRFMIPGFFEAWHFSVRDGEIAVQRK